MVKDNACLRSPVSYDGHYLYLKNNIDTSGFCKFCISSSVCPEKISWTDHVRNEDVLLRGGKAMATYP
jgi:hypothetical protein